MCLSFVQNETGNKGEKEGKKKNAYGRFVNSIHTQKVLISVYIITDGTKFK